MNLFSDAFSYESCDATSELTNDHVGLFYIQRYASLLNRFCLM